MDINRELAGLLGLCWHEIINTYEQTGWNEGFIYKCQKCNKISNHNEYHNPDFTTGSGKIELLRLMEKHLGKFEFEEFLCEVNKDDIYNCISVDLIKDTTGLLAQAALEWLTAQEG
jgi:hypothetical protein